MESESLLASKSKSIGIPKALLFLASVLAVLYVRLAYFLPLTAYTQMKHDDALFVRNALYLIHGHWMGPYSEVTLLKGVGFPIWIALCWLIGIPLFVGNAVLFLVGTLFLVHSFLDEFRIKFLLVLVWALTVFNPETLGDAARRIIRESFYTSLVLCLVAGIAAMIVARQKTMKARIPSALITGILVGFIWITRDEGAALIPCLALFSAYLLFKNRVGLKKELTILLITCLGAGAVNFAVALKNRAYYGSFSTVELKDPAFLSAYGSISRIIPEKDVLRVPATRETLKRIAREVPTFESIYDKIDFSWSEFGCRMFNIVPCDGEIQAGFFLFALRDAVNANGYYTSGRKAHEFYQDLAEKIDRACDSKALNCRDKRSTLAPRLQKEFIPLFMDRLGPAISLLVRFPGIMENGPDKSVGLPQIVKNFEGITGSVAAQPPQMYFVRASIGSKPIRKLSIDSLPLQGHTFSVSWADFGHSNGRFNYQAEIHGSPIRSLNLILSFEDGTSEQIPLSSVFSSESIKGHGFTWTRLADEFDDRDPNWLQTDRAAWSVRIVKGIGRFYSVVSPILALVGLLCFALLNFNAFRSKSVSDRLAIQWFILVLIITRVGLFLYVDVTAFIALSPGYYNCLFPLTTFLLCFSIVTFIDERIPRRTLG